MQRAIRYSRGVLGGTVAAETLEETLAILRGLRVSVDATIEQLGRIRSPEDLMARARLESGGLPQSAMVAAAQADDSMHEVLGTPGRIANKASRESDAARADAVESGPVIRQGEVP